MSISALAWKASTTALCRLYVLISSRQSEYRYFVLVAALGECQADREDFGTILFLEGIKSSAESLPGRAHFYEARVSI